MNSFIDWLKTRNLNSHAVFVAIVSASGLIMTDQAVRNWVLSLFIHHPDIGTAIVGLAGIIFKYSSANKSNPPQPPPPAKEN